MHPIIISITGMMHSYWDGMHVDTRIEWMYRQK